MQRQTVQRSLVLAALMQAKGHPTAEEVYAAVRKMQPSVSRATVYRQLNNLCAEGLAERVSMPNEADRFDKNATGHLHIRCVVCGAVCDARAEWVSGLAQSVQSETGYLVFARQVVLSGICPGCQKNGNASE